MKFGKYEWDKFDDEGKVLLVCKEIIALKQFDENNCNTWELSTLRKWLNGEFLNKFTMDEQSMIDREIFILSLDEIEKHMPNQADRIKKYENENHWYWTRTPFPDYSSIVYDVYNDGSFYWDFACYANRGVVPALYLKSDICESDLKCIQEVKEHTEVKEYTMEDLVELLGYEFKLISKK